MLKKIKDLTIKDLYKMCKKHFSKQCKNCPIKKALGQDCWSIPSFYTEEELELEVENE